MIVDNMEIENIYSLKPGFIGQIRLKNGNEYYGIVDYLDYCDGGVRLIDGYVYEVTIVGTVQKHFEEVFIKEEDVLCCMDKRPIIVYKND